MFFKYTVIAAVFIAGVALFLKSKAAYFALGWLLVVPLPLIAISVAEQPLGLFRQQPRQEKIFIYVWIFIALIELFLIWVPAFGAMIRAVRGTSSDPVGPAGSNEAHPKGVDGA